MLDAVTATNVRTIVSVLTLIGSTVTCAGAGLKASSEICGTFQTQTGAIRSLTTAVQENTSAVKLLNEKWHDADKRLTVLERGSG